MKNIKKLWITTSSGGSFPFWETDITDNEELKNEYDDFKNSLCLVPYDDLKKEKEKVEKLVRVLKSPKSDVRFITVLGALEWREEVEKILKEIEG